MEVILREDVAKLGHSGDVVKVKAGYARNYLLPRGLAYPATEGSKRRLEAELQHRKHKLAMALGEAQAVARALADLTLHFTAKSGDSDKLFGSITTADIAARLAEQGHQIDKRIIELPEPIKMIGDHKVAIRLHADVRPEITVSVVKE